MGYMGNWLPTTIGVVAMVVVLQQGALAKTAREINQIAKAITVSISFPGGNGSGILLRRDGDVYTVLTAAHVAEGKPVTVSAIITPDDQKYGVIAGSVRAYKGDVDLAVLKFRSSKSYNLAELGDSNILEGGMDLYVAGFPLPTTVITESVFVFRKGIVAANSKRAFKNGYALLYDNSTLPGMSGGPVLNEEGKVVGIHGKGDREDQGNGPKTGFNAGIPIARFADVSGGLGVETGTAVARTVQNPNLTADDYFALANQKKDDRDYQGALADYNQAIALKPDYAEAYAGRGFLKYLHLSDFQGALADYNQAILIKPNYTSAYADRGFLRGNNLNDLQGALADFDKAINLKPDDAYVYGLRGVLKFLKLNDLRGALADFNKEIVLSPEKIELYLLRGNVKGGLNDSQGALEDFNKAISLNPNFALTYVARGGLKYSRLNDTQGALMDLNKAITLDPSNAEAYNFRAVLKWQNLNDSRDVLADLDKAITLQPNNAAVYYSRGDFFYMTGRTARALQDFRKASEPGLLGYLELQAKGILALEQRQFASAINNFNQAISEQPELGDMYKYRGLAYRRQGEATQAIQDWRKAAQLYKKNNATKDYQIVRGWMRELGVKNKDLP
jgi:tetratricopeptide (TPR) repeat protein